MALIFALVALAIIASMIGIVAASIQPRITTHNHLERGVRLTALVDAALANTLAELAVNRYFTGVMEKPLGEGRVSSTVRPLTLHEVEIVAVGRARNWRSVVVARVNLEHGPRVVRWHRFQSPE
jgi:hypothetical protein